MFWYENKTKILRRNIFFFFFHAPFLLLFTSHWTALRLTDTHLPYMSLSVCLFLCLVCWCSNLSWGDKCETQWEEQSEWRRKRQSWNFRGNFVPRCSLCFHHVLQTHEFIQMMERMFFFMTITGVTFKSPFIILLKDVYLLASAWKKPLSIFWGLENLFYWSILKFQSNPNQTRLKN